MTTNKNGDIAVGVPVFSRTEALAQFLESVPQYVSTAYVADNGRHEERADLYARRWAFDLEVLRPGFDVGIGACRAAITNAVDEPYLWMGDCDMEFVRFGDLRQLRRILEHNPELGGVSGWLREGDTVRSGARNLIEERGRVYKAVADGGRVDDEPLPFSTFDMVPQAGLFRSEVYETYSYDPDAGSTEHLDFFLGHKRAGEWEFASTPAVVINHHRDIDEDYRQERVSDHTELSFVAGKWGVEHIHNGRRSDWVTTDEQPLHEQGFDLLRRIAPRAVWTPLYRGVKAVL
jgi:hypothetical protein